MESDRPISHEDAMKLVLADPAVRAEYDRLEHRERLINQVIGARLARGWSQADLARALGVQRPVVSRFESGDVDPRWSTVVRVFTALEIPLTAGTGADSSLLAG
ncbi:MAG: putative Xre family binding protein [Thermoleophilia bacterium]|nr:putative Xre family binding protein [Thermoleophilia bacterium]MCZ4496631.1 putative Xre family binding protein [Thermoleophilia bacterium]